MALHIELKQSIRCDFCKRTLIKANNCRSLLPALRQVISRSDLPLRATELQIDIPFVSCQYAQMMFFQRHR